MALPSSSDYIASINNLSCIKDPKLSGGKPIIGTRGTPIVYVGSFNTVFPFSTLQQKYAVRCWIRDIGSAKQRTEAISRFLQRLGSPYFVEFDYVENGIVAGNGTQPLVRMQWIEGQKIKEYMMAHLNNPATLNKLAEDFKTMVQYLHDQGISHGDLQHGNILVKRNGDLVLVDYDSMYVPALKGWQDIIKGVPGYQHSARMKHQDLSPKIDYFSELVIFLSIKAVAEDPSLFEDLEFEDSDCMLFTDEDIKSKGSAAIFQRFEGDE